MKDNSDPRPMFYGAIPATFAKAKLLLKHPTEEEEFLWDFVRKNQLGAKFRKQHPIAQYIVDFYCHRFQLAVELDGDYHLDREQKQKDIQRQNNLEEKGIRVIRFTNE